jgi:hypothetical protein
VLVIVHHASTMYDRCNDDTDDCEGELIERPKFLRWCGMAEFDKVCRTAKVDVADFLSKQLVFNHMFRNEELV